MGELARDPSLVAMSLPVDYWDYLGWKDTLALARPFQPPARLCRTRAATARSIRRRWWSTASSHVLGSDKAAIERAIAQTRAKRQPLSVPVTLKVPATR